MFLTNMGERPARIGFDVVALGTHYYLTKLKLQPHETRAIDLRKLRDAQTADLKGNKIPAQASDGSVVWSRLDNVPVMGRLLVLQRHKGISSNYDCSICDCPPAFTALELEPSSITLLVNDTIWCDAEARFEEYCNNYYWWYYVNADYISSDPNIASITTGGLVTGLSGGLATMTGTYSDYYYSWNSPLQDCVEHSRTMSAHCTAKVAVPTNFHMSAAEDAGGGVNPLLHITFVWQSSTGDLSDLSGCQLRERVTYSASNNSACPDNIPPGLCFYPTSPPWPTPGQPGTGYPNPTDIAGSASAGGIFDNNAITNLQFVQPYSANSFPSTQYFQHSCNAQQTWTNIYGPVTITRSMFKNAQNKWAVKVSRSDTSVTSTYVIPGQ
jgi:hypothetical protein